MDINEKDYCELFGVEPEGAQEQEPAEPANGEEPIDAGAQEQEPAEPAAEEPENPETEEEPEEEPEDEKQQTPQERARYAAIRRKAEAERDAAIKKAREEAQKQAQEQIESAFSSAGLVNPYTKQPIRSKADFDEYKAKPVSYTHLPVPVVKDRGITVDQVAEMEEAIENKRAYEYFETMWPDYALNEATFTKNAVNMGNYIHIEMRRVKAAGDPGADFARKKTKTEARRCTGTNEG